MMVYLNGKLVPEKQALISVNDHGFLYGDGVYETIRVYGGRPFLMHEHLRRFNSSMQGIKLLPPMSLMELGRAVHRTVAANKLKEAVVRITITRGPGPRGLDPALCKRPTVVVTAVPFAAPPADHYRRGIVAAVVSVRRNGPRALPPDIKSTSCLNSVLAKIEATDLSAHDAILLTEDDFVAEATTSNVFVVKGSALTTPRTDGHLLPGVTRQWVIQLARSLGFTVGEKKVPLLGLAGADEVFLTSTVAGIMPVGRLIFNHGSQPRVVRMGPYSRSSGYVGPVTLELMRRYRDSVRSFERLSRPRSADGERRV